MNSFFRTVKHVAKVYDEDMHYWMDHLVVGPILILVFGWIFIMCLYAFLIVLI